ncbi:hypothetical protein [Streptococcus iniae]|uniref:hypothetical protein n=1 Tax=Streptococcus iniae TaxID=1346 RepID=UPI0002830B19|nr:hypothetical protein [Streptococcus iniae]AGM99574.1 DNA-binding protein [Streptococcus iniae SF1]AJG26641.1 DNA-binding protein [Streptococcus iniae]APD32516.1 DNA-binding protein [Streptococcus iniae]ASL35484.1 transcriptional regulator [Streptococcus iniae]ATX38485.1 hypothetical protein CTW00_00243 [Streptococcus iniae]
MTSIIDKNDKKSYERNSVTMLGLMVIIAVAIFPLLYFFGWLGFITYLILWGICLFYAYRVEAFKNKYQIHTYKEIHCLANSTQLSPIEKCQEKAKYPYQKVAIVLGFTIIFAVVSLMSSLFFLWLFHLKI